MTDTGSHHRHTVLIAISKGLQQEVLRILNSLLLASLTRDDEGAVVTYLNSVNDAIDRFGSDGEKFKTFVMSEDLTNFRTALFESWNEINAPLNHAKALLSEGKFDEGKELVREQLRPALKDMAEILKNIELINTELIESSKIEAINLSWRGKAFAVISAILASLFSLLISFISATAISKRFARIGNTLSNSAEQVSRMAEQIAHSSAELSGASNQQGDSLGRTSSAIDETSSMVAKNSENAKNAAATSLDSQQKAEAGRQVVERMIRSMDQINLSNDNILKQIDLNNTQMREIVGVIREIGNKTKVINDIVFQTKLLSFNASVEAARAGEHGKGFAVVAEEVGNLARMSQDAAQEITDLLSGSIQKVDATVAETSSKIEILITEGRNIVQGGVSVAQQCHQVLTEIIDKIARVSNMAEEISSASQDQADGVQEITKSVHDLNTITQKNMTSGKESANTAKELAEQADTLRSAVILLVTMIQGSRP